MSIHSALGNTSSPKDGLVKISAIIGRLRTDISDRPDNRHLENAGDNPLCALIGDIIEYVECLNIGSEASKGFLSKLRQMRVKIQESVREGYYILGGFPNMEADIQRMANAKLPAETQCSYADVSEGVRIVWRLNNTPGAIRQAPAA